MTLESGAQPAYAGQRLSPEVRTDRDVQIEKYAEPIAALLTQILHSTIDAKGLLEQPNPIADYKLEAAVVPPGRHIQDVKAALFQDVLWLRGATMGLPNKLHTLQLSRMDAQHVYHVRGLNVDSETPTDRLMTGVEEIAADPDVVTTFIDLGDIRGSVLRKRDAGWGYSALSANSLRIARKARQAERWQAEQDAVILR